MTLLVDEKAILSSKLDVENAKVPVHLFLALCSEAPMTLLVDEEDILSSKLDAFVSGRFEPN